MIGASPPQVFGSPDRRIRIQSRGGTPFTIPAFDRRSRHFGRSVKGRAPEFRELADGKTLDDIWVRLRHRARSAKAPPRPAHFDVQLVGGHVLMKGRNRRR